MTFLNRAFSASFDALLGVLDFMGRGAALVFVSGVFGVLALLLFKRLSWQRGIKAAKDKIKAHLIEIRIYQDDPRIVLRAFGCVLWRNAQYLGLNLIPFVPLAIPFTFVVAQLVVRDAFAPATVRADVANVMPGQGTTLRVELESSSAARVKDLVVRYPEGLVPISPLVRVPAAGRAYQEFVATRAGEHDIELELGDGARETKHFAAGNVSPRRMQPERAKGVLHALLWPAEDTVSSDSPFARIRVEYPDSDLGWFPGGTGGVLLVFLAASMLFGALAIKPLKIQI